MNITQKINTPSYTKQEKENSRKMHQYFRYEKLMKQARSSKEDYLECLEKDPKKLDEKNRIALKNLIVIFKADALEFWNKAEALKNEYPFIDEMIKNK
tara:strand:+ start:786 stop:1079 length:294 start_codon:yes stop_codon:yes gene_type:complete